MSTDPGPYTAAFNAAEPCSLRTPVSPPNRWTLPTCAGSDRLS